MICAEDFDVSDEPAISSSVSLNTRHYERLQRAQDALDCSATAKFCEFCTTSMHTEVNILHRVEILKVRKLV